MTYVRNLPRKLFRLKYKHLFLSSNQMYCYDELTMALMYFKICILLSVKTALHAFFVWDYT